MTTAVLKWKDYWLTLPDNVFFEAIKTYPLPGCASASFNKHKLVDALISFFTNEENAQMIIRSLDESDRKLLSAVSVFGHLTPLQFYFFFQKDETEEKFFFHLINLEERLLIYRDPAGSTLALNPILEPRFEKEFVSFRYFFSASPERQTQAPVIPAISDSLFLTTAAFLEANPKAVRKNGELRKKSKESLLKIFHVNETEDRFGETTIRCLLSFFIKTSILAQKDDSLSFDAQTFLSFRKTELSDLIFLIMAADPRLSESNSLSDTAALLRALTRETGRLKSCSADDFTALFYLLSGCSGQAQTAAPLFLTVLLDFRFLLQSGKRIYPNPILNLNDCCHYENKTILQDDGQILYSPWSNPEYSFYLPLFADIAGFNLFPVFQMTKETLFRGFDAGLTPQKTAEILHSLSCHPLSRAIEKKILTAYDLYREVKILTGMTVILPPVKAAAAAKLPVLKKIMIARPAENVFIFPEDSFADVRKELIGLGITYVPAPSEPHRQSRRSEPRISPLKDPLLTFHPDSDAPVRQCGSGSDDLRQNLLTELKTRHYPAILEKDIEAKIRKKIILLPEQIPIHAQRSNPAIASGLDYTRKLNLIKTAVKDPSFLLEMTLISNGERLSLPAVPTELKKQNSRYTLFYRIPGHSQVFSADAEKIVSVKLIRSSLWLY